MSKSVWQGAGFRKKSNLDNGGNSSLILNNQGAKKSGSLAHKLSDIIKRSYWRRLVRRVDQSGLAQLFSDSKVIDLTPRIYVPYADERAFRYFSNLKIEKRFKRLKVLRLPEVITPQYVQSINNKPGILSLHLYRETDGSLRGAPFIVPGGRFNELFGWDSYFVIKGLLIDGFTDLAKSIIDNLVYEIEHYGAILNANRTYFLSRSQPPLLPTMAREVYAQLEKNSQNKCWLKSVVFAAIAEYRSVWNHPDHYTEATQLTRYFGRGEGMPPEVEPGHFDPFLKSYAYKAGMSVKRYVNRYVNGKIKEPKLDQFFVQDRAMRESGHDRSYRTFGCTADLNTVDLNSLLYRYEMDLSEMIAREWGGSIELPDGSKELSSDWAKRAEKRKKQINKFLWDEARGIYLDYNFRLKRAHEYISATALYPLWAGVASPKQAGRLISNLLPVLEFSGGIGSSDQRSPGGILSDRPQSQWDYPFGWAPHQMLIWDGLRRYGFEEIIQRLVYKWLTMILKCAVIHGGAIAEKYDVAACSLEAYAEYGNESADSDSETGAGFGWTNASFQYGLSLVNERGRELLYGMTVDDCLELDQVISMGLMDW